MCTAHHEEGRVSTDVLAIGQEKESEHAEATQLAEVTQLAQTLEVPVQCPSQKHKWQSD